MAVLHETEAKLIDAMPDGILLVGGAGLLVAVNAQAERLFGYARAELVGESIETLIPDRFRTGHKGNRTRYSSAFESRLHSMRSRARSER